MKKKNCIYFRRDGPVSLIPPSLIGREKRINFQQSNLKFNNQKKRKMETIVKITADEVVSAYTAIGASPKKIAQLNFTADETPLQGKIIRFNPEAKEYNGNKYFTFDVERPDGTIGSMSVSRLNDTEVVKDRIIIVKSEKNAGKAMLQPTRVSGDTIRNIGRSEAERIANMIGKSYRAERITGNVVVEYTDDKLFVKPKNVTNLIKAEKDALWANTAVSERLFKFIELT